jgi:anaphase-promoting complex subunit 8
MDDFLIRGLYKTVDFLTKIRTKLTSTSLVYTPSDILYTTYFNLKEYALSYNHLLCETSRLHNNKMVFCTCCDPRTVFMRNYSLFMLKKDQKIDCINLNEDMDPFLMYLIGLVNKDINILYEVTKLNNIFWEAYLAIIDLTTSDNLLDIIGPLSNYFYMTLYVKKQISKRSFKLESEYPNLEGAVLYYRREYNKSQNIFKKILNRDIFCTDYMDLYSNILYLKKDVLLYDLSHRLLEINRYRPETLCSIANTYSYKKNHLKAIEYYDLCIKLSPSSSLIYTLLGHEYLEMKDYKKSIESYTNAIKYCAEDYRAWYSLGKVYEILNVYESALFYYKKSIEYKKDDSLIWLGLGNIHVMLREYEEGIKCFKRSVKLKDVMGYLYIAETYKTMKMYCESAEYYERYVCGCKYKDEDVKKICVFLEEYYKKMCDEEKSKKYYEMGKNI